MIPSRTARVCRAAVAGLAALAACSSHPAPALPGAETGLRGVYTADIDRTAAACTDFYTYPNGAWRKQNPIGDFFAGCMDEARIDQLGNAPIRPLLAEIEQIRERGDVGLPAPCDAVFHGERAPRNAAAPIERRRALHGLVCWLTEAPLRGAPPVPLLPIPRVSSILPTVWLCRIGSANWKHRRQRR